MNDKYKTIKWLFWQFICWHLVHLFTTNTSLSFYFLLFLFGISFINHNDQFKARNHIFMFMFSHRTFFQLLKTGYLSLFTFLALTSIFKYTTQNIYIFKSVKSSSSIHNRHNRIHYRLLIYILTYIRQNFCNTSFILKLKDIFIWIIKCMIRS